MFRTQARAVPPGPHGTSLDWVSYFTLNTMEPALPWSDPYRLTLVERSGIGRSIQQFQLGENSEGRGLQHRAREYGQTHGDAQFPEAVLLFIQEEQRHSRILGRFLDLNAIPRLGAHWVDTVFRRVRALAGLGLCMRVLATAEIIAVPYYTALGKATPSALLAKICANILADEAAHLQFQSFVFALLAEGRSARQQRVVNALHNAFLQVTAAVVWLEHSDVLRAAGSSFPAFRAECRELLRGVFSPPRSAPVKRGDSPRIPGAILGATEASQRPGAGKGAA